MRVVVTARKRKRPRGWVGTAVAGLCGLAIGVVRLGFVATAVTAVLANLGLIGLGWLYPRLYSRRSRRRSRQAFVLSAPASAYGSVAGKITVGPDRLHFVPARHGEEIDVDYRHVAEVEVARTPLVSATRIWVRTTNGRETLFTITAPIAAVTAALGDGTDPASQANP
ncbi:MAG: hypothetical protein NVS3B21_10990 [Acidimicrobiales bacterium]